MNSFINKLKKLVGSKTSIIFKHNKKKVQSNELFSPLLHFLFFFFSKKDISEEKVLKFMTKKVNSFLYL